MSTGKPTSEPLFYDLCVYIPLEWEENVEALDKEVEELIRLFSSGAPSPEQKPVEQNRSSTDEFRCYTFRFKDGFTAHACLSDFILYCPFANLGVLAYRIDPEILKAGEPVPQNCIETLGDYVGTRICDCPEHDDKTSDLN